jgi:hypothetical protein
MQKGFESETPTLAGNVFISGMPICYSMCSDVNKVNADPNPVPYRIRIRIQGFDN